MSNVQNETSEQLLAKVFELVDSECEIISCSYVSNTEFSATIRACLTPDTAGSYASACNSWILKFSEVTKTNWIVFKTFPSLTKLAFRKQFVCQHSSKGKARHATNVKPRSRNLDCHGSINLVVRKSTRDTKKKIR